MSPASRFRPMASSRDRRLEGLLATLSARLGCSSETAVYVGADECEGICELADALVDAGLLLPAEPAGALICDGCEQNCAMPVAIAPASAGQPGRAFIVCDKRDDIGRVSVEPPRLRRWMFSLPVLALALAKVFNTDQEPAQAGSGSSWCLGKAKVGAGTVQVALARSAENVPTGTQLAVLLADPSNDADRGRWIALATGFSLRDGRLVSRANVLRMALSKRFDDPTVAVEARFHYGEVLLIDRIGGRSRKLATPRLGSQNYQVFEVLCANPGQIFTAAELRQKTGLRALKSLHKIPENLNFIGNLKKLFFEVSKNSIRFSPEITLGQLALYHIDPTSII
jgi:hypothetical protein